MIVRLEITISYLTLDTRKETVTALKVDNHVNYSYSVYDKTSPHLFLMLQEIAHATSLLTYCFLNCPNVGKFLFSFISYL